MVSVGVPCAGLHASKSRPKTSTFAAGLDELHPKLQQVPIPWRLEEDPVPVDPAAALFR